MTRAVMNRKSRLYQLVVTTAGIGLWAAVAASILINYAVRDQLTFLALVPLIIAVSMFVHIFRLPSGLKFSETTFSFSLSDAVVILVACWHGLAPAVFLAGIEGFATSRRGVRRLSSNLFSSSMMSLTAAAASIVLQCVMIYGFNQAGNGPHHPLLAVAVAVLAGSLVQITTNIALLSTLLALRYDNSLAHQWKDFLWTAPMFLPTGTAASLIYFALQYNVWITLVVGGPIFAAIYIGHRQYQDSVKKRVSVMEKAHRETIEALAVTINAKDEVTHEHVLRVQLYATGVARLLNCSSAEIEALKAGALLHDIGKIAVPDHILHKPGKLTAAEFEKMKSHTLVGARILGRVDFPYPVVPIVRNHHERWDGKGYPDGLAGEDIPLTARIISVVDCFDAVREDRQYRKGMTREEAVKLIMDGSGTHYDPRVVVTFIAHLPEFEAEIDALRDVPVPTFGLEPIEEMSDAARDVAPAAGLAEAEAASSAKQIEVSVHAEFSHKELSGLYDLALGVNAARSRNEITQAFTSKIGQIVPYDLCAVTLVAPESGDNLIVHAAGQDAALLENRIVGVGEGVTGWVLTNRKPFCNVDPKLDVPPELAEKFADYRTLAIFPIIGNREMHGTFALYSSTLSEYTADHQRLLKEAAMLVAAALSTQAAMAQPRTTQSLINDNLLETDLLYTTASLESPDAALELELTH